MSTARTASYLKIASIVLAGVGLVSAIAAWPPLAFPNTVLAEIILWRFDGSVSLASPEARLLTAILGGVLFGWGIMIWQMVDRFYAQHPEETGRVIVTGTLCWYCVDSLACVAAGAWLNVFINLGFLAMLVLPVMFSGGRRQMPGGASA